MISTTFLAVAALQVVPITFSATIQGQGFLTVPVERTNNGYYEGEIEVGTPGQRMNVIFDTATADSWLQAKACKLCPAVKTPFDPQASSTFVGSSTQYTEYYGGGYVYGNIGKDTFKIGGNPVKNQAFAVVNENTGNIEGPNGVFGLAYQKISRHSSDKTPLQNLKEQGAIGQNVFAFHLRPSGQSVLTLGGFDSSLAAHGVTWSPIAVNYNWMVVVDSITLGGAAVSGKIKTVLVSGTRAITVNSETHELIVKKLGAQHKKNGVYQVECQGLPSLDFKIRGSTFAVENAHYAFKTDDSELDRGKCRLGIERDDRLQTLALLGDAFMQEKLIIFDGDNNKIGISVAK